MSGSQTKGVFPAHVTGWLASSKMPKYAGITRLVCAFLLLSSGPGFAQKVQVGETAAIVRSVEGTYEAVIRKLALADPIYHNEVIATRADSASKIRFSDDTILTVGPESSVTLDAFVFDPNTKNSKMVVNAAVGVARFVTGRMGSPAYQIKTPTATIGVRGTVLTVSVAEDGATSVIVEDGAAIVTGQSGDPVNVPEGLSSNVPSGGPASDAAPPDPEVASGVADMDVSLLLEGGAGGNNEAINDEGLQEITQETEQLRESGCGC